MVAHRSCNIFVNRRANFYQSDDVKINNCRFWDKLIPNVVYHVPLNSLEDIVWCGMIAYFNFEPHFFEKQSTFKPVTCTGISTGLASMLRRCDTGTSAILNFRLCDYFAKSSRCTLHIAH